MPPFQCQSEDGSSAGFDVAGGAEAGAKDQDTGSPAGGDISVLVCEKQNEESNAIAKTQRYTPRWKAGVKRQVLIYLCLEDCTFPQLCKADFNERAVPVVGHGSFGSEWWLAVGHGEVACGVGRADVLRARSDQAVVVVLLD